MSKYLSLLLILVALSGAPVAVRADEATRAAQEELRKRKIYFGDVDGRSTPSFLDAVKKYQARKGFSVTGQTDSDTLRSLGISSPKSATVLPDVPVLRSDRNIAAAPVESAPAATPPRPTNAPPATSTEMDAWVRRYLEACMTPDVNDELAYYADYVDYFHHGTVRKEDIGRELATYMQQWPTRRYSISGPVRVNTTDDGPVVRSRITFELESGDSRKASGNVDNTFTVARRADMSWEIIGQTEERVRQTARRRSSRRKQPALSPVERTLRKFFGTPARRRSR